MTLAPAYLAPYWRYVDNDWAGPAALTYTAYSVAPVIAADGTVSGGTVMDLTGCTVQGIITIRREGKVLPAPDGAIVGNPTLGQISLSLLRPYTHLQAQPFSDWSNPDLSCLIVRPQVVSQGGYLVTQGIQPVFVF